VLIDDGDAEAQTQEFLVSISDWDIPLAWWAGSGLTQIPRTLRGRAPHLQQNALKEGDKKRVPGYPQDMVMIMELFGPQGV
jgi:hypothetical protein